jgi:hypothetical protein
MTFSSLLACLVIGNAVSVLATSNTSIARTFQPQITVVESHPQRLNYASISFPEGSPWCGGNATFWLVGHQLYETPYCYNAENKSWTTPEIAMMDMDGDLNDLSVIPPYIDRHGCSTLDVNKDGLLDIVCGVGAGKGNGLGYNELYLTQKDGSLQKVLRHGLQEFPYIRCRFVATLYNRVDPGNITHVFISAYGTYRTDGQVNWHTMYRLIDGEPYFVNVPGPWNVHAKVIQITVADWNQDGRDDLIVMHKNKATLFFEQQQNGTFLQVKYTRNYRTNRVRSARVADVDLDGVQDLIVTTSGFRSRGRKWFNPSLRIFKGINAPERFNFSSFYFRTTLPYEAPDIEILDVNSDGIPDIYVILRDESKDMYCGQRMSENLKPFPPGNWTAPLDKANDLLFIGNGYTVNSSELFKSIEMNHVLPGCGFIARLFGDNKTMILANGDEGHVGSNAILKWS